VSVRLLAAMMLAVLCGCGPLALGFRNEMREKDSREGLALGYIGGSGMKILPLGGGLLTDENLQNHSGPCESCPGWFSSDGRLILWELPWPFGKPEDPSLIVRTVTGAPVATWSGQLNDIAALALSPDRSRVALEVQNYFPGAPATGLQYVVLGTPNRVMIEGMPQQNEADASDSLGWSADSRKIVFSRRRKVIILNIETGDRNTIADGSEPAWSPDGHWISFTSPGRIAMLVDASSRRTMTLYGGRTITGPMAWSPDSCCVSFSDGHKNLADAVLFSESRMIVYRITDGAWYVLKRFGPDGGTSAHFGWLYNYREFLARNNRVEKMPR
jgi:WD40-like Beta Propeller Repeat